MSNSNLTKDKGVKGWVFTSGYGLVEFKSTKRHTFQDEIQFIGKIKVNNLFTSNGKNWFPIDFYYDLEQVFASRDLAIESLCECEDYEPNYDVKVGTVVSTCCHNSLMTVCKIVDDVAICTYFERVGDGWEGPIEEAHLTGDLKVNV